uniref:Putative dicerB n=1 Tax=Actinia equina TaxID=6106 RepID=A0A2S1PRV8_ACTEQ|nr:putative dicerB [Actinia equina]
MEYDSDIESEDDAAPDLTTRDESGAQENQESLSARPYQVELLVKALEKNIVVCLGTGTGKTFISVLLIKELSHQIMKDYEDGGKRTFFLVNTVPLVAQQRKVIDQNTDLSVGKYVGEDGVDFWGKERWLKELKDHQVLVMTAQIFVDMLGHGKIQLSKVNLIVFDECHHAKKEHPYAQVMRYFTAYNRYDHPRVLGLTASIVNGKVKPHRIEQEIQTLERILRASCETSSDECVGKYATKPTEYAHPYSTREDVSAEEKQLQERLNQEVLFPWDEFLNDVRDKSETMKISKSIVKECIETLEVLGASAANRVAEYFLDVTGRFSRTRGLLSSEYSHWLMGYNSTQLRQVQKIYKTYKTELYGPSNNSVQHVSAKVKALVEILKQYGTGDKKLCGIVFVQRRCTAAVLCEQITLLSQHDKALSFVKCEYVVGHGMVGTAASSAKDMSCKKQDKVLEKFRNHEFNLLIATSVVEEGLDVPRCNLVVRFDFPMTFQSYVQSKGRARAKDSFYIILLPDGQDTAELEMYQAIEEYLSHVCYDRRIPTDEESTEAVDTDLLQPYRTRKGASVTMANSIALLCKYCSKLPGDRFTLINPDYKTVEVGKDAFQTTLTMPINCPIKEKIMGDPMPRKKQAKMAAAYEACKRLHQEGELDDHLFPIESLSDNESEDEDVEMGVAGQPKSGTKRKKQAYPRKVPDILKESLPTGPRDRCYLYGFTKAHNKATDSHSVEEEVLKLGILMTSELPPVRRFTLYPDEGAVTISVIPIAKPQRLTDAQLSLIDQFHSRISSEMLRNSFERQNLDGYYIVPLETSSSTRMDEIRIDFDRAEKVLCQEETVRITCLEDVKSGDSIITPMHRPRERFIIEEICTNLSPMSAFPERSKAKTYEEYFRKEYPSLKRITRRAQPLILVKSMPQRVNFLVDRKKMKSKEKTKKDIHFIPELCTLEPFSAKLLLEARELPSILHRMTSLLLVMEMRKLIAEGCRVDVQQFSVEQNEEDLSTIGGDILTGNAMVENPVPQRLALSSKRDKYNNEFESVSKNLDSLFSNNRTNFLQPDSALLLQALTTKGAGDAFDLERLEMLGDAFLKQAVSIYLFCFYTNKDEGKLTRRKVSQISNLKLYKVSTAHHLPGYIQTTVLDRKSWAPPCLQVKPQSTGKILQERFTSKKKAKKQKLDSESKQEDFSSQTISDKSVADSIEALIGAYLVSGGYKGALYFLDYLGIKVLPDEDNAALSGSPSNYASFLTPPCDPLPSSRPEDLENAALELQGFERRINYEFRNKIYLLQALTHASYAHNRLTPDCYQRLEFLGDAVLDFVVTECLYSRNKRLSPGELTDLRQALVNNNIFAKIAVEHGYHKYLKQTSPEWFKKIGDFVQKLEDDEEEDKPKISDEPFLIMSDKDDEAVEAPKVLGDIFESVAGAVFLDSGMDVVVTWKVYYRMMKPYIDYYSKNVPYNPIRLVHENDSELEFSDARVLDDGKIECELKVSWGRFTGKGANKRIAKAAASRRAMEERKKQPTV